jgi:hypothetical protein
VKQRTDQAPIQAMTILRTACMTAFLAVPLAACSDRTDDSGNAQVDAQQAARDKEVERRVGKEQPPLPDNEIESADRYGAPRESWTAGATARDAEFKDSTKADAGALDELTEALAARDDSDMIKIEVQDGIAHLEGEVESVLDRREIETMALAVEGIVAVRNDLEVGRNLD